MCIRLVVIVYIRVAAASQQQGIIAPTRWCARIVVMPKKITDRNHCIRMCVDLSNSSLIAPYHYACRPLNDHDTRIYICKYTCKE